jgi:hypothetical protein
MKKQGPARLRIRLGIRLSVLLLAITVVSVVGQQTSSAASGPPTLSFSNSATQSTLGAAYTMALKNLLTTNTVSYDPSVFNTSGLMTNPPGTFIRAGGGYPQPWTRDASVNSWNAASLLEPQVAANTLWSAVVKQANGQLILVQDDNETWDQVVWMTAAWNHYLVTGDNTFLANAYQVATNTLNLRKANNFNSSYGLFEGPAFFNDGIAGYPAPPADSTESQGSYVGSYSATNTMMTLSTNTLYYSAYRSAALMASTLGRPASEVAALNASADSLKTAINQHLWNSSTGMYGYFIHGNDSLAGQLDQTEEGTGLSFAILFGIASTSQAQSIMQNAHVQPYGVVDTYPNFARYSAAQPGRHNVSVWPMVEGFWADAAATTGDAARFASEVENLAGLANSSGQFAEVYNAQTGAVDGGWQTGSHWSAAPDQTWSATAYLRMMYDDLYGMKFTTSGITFAPTLPWGWGDTTLTGVPFRGATLNIALHGAGATISSFKLDGVTTSAHTVSNTLTGTHTVDITLTGGTPGEIKGYGNLCLDDRNASTANSNPIVIWSCNGTGAQQWTVTGNTVHVLGKCLDVSGGGTADGTLVQLYDCNNTGAQVWIPQSNGSLLNPQSNKCLDDPALSTTWGTQVGIWDCNGGANQRWYLPA